MTIDFEENSGQLDFFIDDQINGYVLTFYNIRDYEEEIMVLSVLIAEMGMCPYYNHLKLKEELLEMFRFKGCLEN